LKLLDRITVVSIEQAVAAPFATRQLADWGARVIKIERPGEGDFARAYDTTVRGLASHFVWLNRTKESLALDLKHEVAPAILERLLGVADVFVQNLAPGAAARLGLGAATLREKYPRLIVCDISGYGASGPYRDKKAYDLLIQSESGLVSITGTPETPSKVGISIADIAAGMYAYSGILTALFARERTGIGSAIEISLLESLGEWMGFAAYYTGQSGASLPRSGANHAAIAPYGPFDSADGKTVYLAIQNEREWDRFCQVVLEAPALATDRRFNSNSNRVQHRADLQQAIETILGALPAETIVERLERAHIANARMNTVQEFVQHPQLAARGRWREVESPVGPIPALAPPLNFAGYEPVMGAVPAVGEHTDTILRGLGCTEAMIGAWRTAGAI
jgi:crotonobetainyl-CoA:carnitine CoA-transferase CaiB-like acyl-CoA transferase